MSKNSRMDQMPQDQKDRIMENQVKYAPKFTYVIGVVGTVIFVMVDTGVLGSVQPFYRGGAEIQAIFRDRLACVCAADHQ